MISRSEHHNCLEELQMRYLLAGIICVMLTNSLSADERYKFYSFSCNKTLSFFNANKIVKFNIGDSIWPISGKKIGSEGRKKWLMEKWKSHENSLESIEREYSLYVFGELYGRYSDKPYKCNLGLVDIEIIGKKVARPYIGKDDLQVYYRDFPILTLSINKNRVLQKNLNRGDGVNITIDVGDSYLLYRSCSGKYECDVEHYSISDYLK